MQQQTAVLVGALMFLALYSLVAANAGRVDLYFVFGIWLLARAGTVLVASG